MKMMRCGYKSISCSFWIFLLSLSTVWAHQIQTNCIEKTYQNSANHISDSFNGSIPNGILNLSSIFSPFFLRYMIAVIDPSLPSFMSDTIDKKTATRSFSLNKDILLGTLSEPLSHTDVRLELIAIAGRDQFRRSIDVSFQTQTIHTVDLRFKTSEPNPVFVWLSCRFRSTVEDIPRAQSVEEEASPN